MAFRCGLSKANIAGSKIEWRFALEFSIDCPEYNLNEFPCKSEYDPFFRVPSDPLIGDPDVIKDAGCGSANDPRNIVQTSS